MKKFKILYATPVDKKVFKVYATSNKDAYNKFRRVFGYKNVNFLGIKEVKHNQKHIDRVKFIGHVIVIILAVFLIGLALGKIIWADPTPVSYEKYVVESGDTLWEIAKLSDGINKYDIRFIIDDMLEASDCTANIYPGQIVYIPNYSN